MLVGYLENITSDCKLVDHCSMRMDILYFLGYDIDEQLPWHSTISRTRQLYPATVFEALFNKVFALCVDKGMVRSLYYTRMKVLQNGGDGFFLSLISPAFYENMGDILNGIY